MCPQTGNVEAPPEAKRGGEQRQEKAEGSTPQGWTVPAPRRGAPSNEHALGEGRGGGAAGTQAQSLSGAETRQVKCAESIGSAAVSQ